MTDPIVRTQYDVAGMDCADCGRHVEREIGKINGITSVKVNAVTGKLHISSGQPIAEQIIRQAVTRAGYTMLTQPAFADPQTGQDSNKPAPSTGSAKILLPAVLAVLFILAGIAADRLFQLPQLSIYLYLAAIISSGYNMAVQGIKEAIRFRLGMNFLMTVAVGGAMIIGDWLEGATVVLLFALAQYLEDRTMDKARRSIRNLIEQKPKIATRIIDQQQVSIPVEQVAAGHLLAVKPGEQIPVDGKIEQGDSTVDQSSITGESQPVVLAAGDPVYGGTLNQNGFLVIRAERSFSNSTFSKIVEQVVEAQAQKAPRQKFVDTFAGYYTPAVLAIAILIALIPPLFFAAPFINWFYRALVMLVIACPCALVISTPVTIISALTAAMRRGILIRGGLHLENFAHLQAIAFDKTGTLTEGKFKVQQIYPAGDSSAEQVLLIAASLENKSNHPIARAICAQAERHNLQLAEVRDFSSLAGQGLEGLIDGHRYVLGNHKLFEQRNLCKTEIHGLLNEIEDQNHTAVLVGNQTALLGIISIADSVRTGAAAVIQQLKKQGIRKMILLTGDNHRTAAAVAAGLQLDDYAAELLPADKVDVLKKLKNEFRGIAMVGDGVNDAPALAAADIGIAMAAGGSDVAIETADIALLDDRLAKLAVLRQLSTTTLRLIKQNIIVALGLKLVFLILAALGLATLWMAVFADMGASLIVIFNGLRVISLK
jgi:Cd2+/Zn2+-exporting ATPase